MFQTITKITLLFFVIVGLSSCIELKEELFLKKNGQGTYRFVFDASQSAPMIQMMLTEASLSNNNSDSSTQKLLDNSFTALQELAESAKGQGIHQAVAISDTSKHIFGLRFDFESVEHLNEAMQRMFGDKETLNPSFLYTQKGTIERLHSQHIIEIIQQLSFEETEGNPETAATNPMDIFLKNASYHFAFRTEGKIKQTSHKGFVDSHKNQVGFSIPFLSVQEYLNWLKYKIKFK